MVDQYLEYNNNMQHHCKRKTDDVQYSQHASLLYEDVDDAEKEDRDVAVAVSFLTSDYFQHQFSQQNTKEWELLREFDAADLAIVQILSEIPTMDLAQHNVDVNTNLQNKTDFHAPVASSSSCRSNKPQKRFCSGVSFRSMYECLCNFSALHGHFNVPKRYIFIDDDGSPRNLGQWMCDQRKSYLSATLAEDRRCLFSGLISKSLLNWQLKSTQDQWETCFQALVQYGEKHGDCNVPREYCVDIHQEGSPSPQHIKLGNWLHKQRSNKASEKLSPSKCLRMQSLVDRGVFFWEARSRIEACRWEACYRTLVEYVENGGLCEEIPNSIEVTFTNSSSVNLSRWLKLQLINKNSGKLSQERQAKLQLLVDQGKMIWYS